MAAGEKAIDLSAVRLVRQTAARIRQFYILNRRIAEERVTGRASKYQPGPKWDGGKDRYNKTHKPIWPRIAFFVLSNRLDVDAFVRRQFEQSGTRPPLPNAFLGDMALCRYRQGVADDEIKVRSSLQAERGWLEMTTYDYLACKDELGYTKAEIIEFSLVNSHAPLSPLFRYCAAKKYGVESVAKNCYWPAVFQYLQNSSLYDKVWDDWIPDKLKKIADRVYGAMMAKRGA